MKQADSIEWDIRPEQLLTDIGWAFRRRGSWLDVKLCPFCEGGEHGDTHTFAVHITDGNFACQRASCGAAGGFWKLLEKVGRNPKDFIRRDGAAAKQKPKRKNKKKGYVYGR